MPRISLQVPETYENTTRPVVLEITRQVLEYTGLDPNTPLLFPDDAETTWQPGSTISRPRQPNDFGQGARFFIEMEEEYDVDRILTTAIDMPENLVVFNDPALGIYMKPAYSHQQVTLNFKYRATDKTAAHKWRDDIRARIARNRDVFLHTATYSYDIPDEFLYILKYLHSLRENQAPYGDTYEEYFKKLIDSRATVKTNLAGRWETWSIPETQQQIQGWFDFEGAPEKGSKEGELEAWTIGFTYRFAFDKPIEMVMEYPLMVHNQVVDKRYRQTSKPYQPEQIRQAYSNSRSAFHVFEKGGVLERVCKLEGETIPAIDEWLPHDVLPGTLRAFTALSRITPDDLRTLGDMNQLGNHFAIQPDVLKYLKDEWQYVNKTDRSVLQLSLYRSHYLQPNDSVRLTPDGIVRATEDLDLREQYHIRLGVVKDIASLSKDVRDRFRNHGKAALVILDAIDCSLKHKDLLPPLIGDDYIGESDLEKALDEINRDVLSNGNGQQYIFFTVGTFFIQAQRAS